MLERIKKDPVLFISGILAIVSCFFVHPDEKYIGYIDFRVLAILFCMMLDTKFKLLGEEKISTGTVDFAVISVRDLFLAAMRHRAVQIILVHNHPSGDPQPSEADINITRRVREAGEMMGVRLLDHIIIGDRCYVSFRESGLMNQEEEDGLS